MLILEDQVTLLAVIDVLLELPLDLKGRWSTTARYLDVFSLLVQDTEGRCAIGIVFLFKRDDLKYVGVPHSDIHCMSQDNSVTIRRILSN